MFFCKSILHYKFSGSCITAACGECLGLKDQGVTRRPKKRGKNNDIQTLEEHHNLKFCPCGGKKVSIWDKEKCVNWIKSSGLKSELDTELVHDLAEKLHDDLDLGMESTGYQDLIFSMPIHCIICTRAISQRAIDEVKMEVEKDRKKRDWHGLVEACHCHKLKDEGEPEEDKWNKAQKGKSVQAQKKEGAGGRRGGRSSSRKRWPKSLIVV